MKWNMISTGDIALRKGGSVDPKKHQDEVFELYSIPAFDAGAPEVVAGSVIGSSKKAVQPNDVMISRIVPHIRRACVVGPANGHRQIASGEWIIFRDERIWPKYLRWVLVGDVFHSDFMRTVSGVGGSLLRARPAEVFKIQIPLPPLDEQRRIAGILDAADALRAKRREVLAQLDTLLQSTFLDMFGDPVTNPKGWEVKSLNELLGEKSTNGAYYPKDAYSSVGTRMVHMANAFYGVVNPNRVKRVDAPLADIEKYGLLPTDILVSRRSLNYEGSAKPCLIPETDEPLIFESSLIRVRPDRKRVLTSYLFHYLLNDRARAKYVFPLVTRSTISGISQSNLMKVKVVLPPLDLQLRFAAVVESIEQQKASQRAHLAELDTLFASLQSRAFRGDL